MLPNFVVIGAMKAGTTSLYAYLGSHPEIFMAEPKELDFFVAEKNWSRGLGWYEARFAAADGAAAVGEASPNYSKFPTFDGVPERMCGVLPEARLLYVLRDPIERMRSHWMHNLAANGARQPIEDALLENDHFLLCSSYALQLERFLEHYPSKRMLLLTAEDLRERRREQLRRVFSFLGVDPDFEPPNLSSELFRSTNLRVPRRPFHGREDPRLRLERGAGGKLHAAVSRLTSRRLDPRRAALPDAVEARLRERLRPDLERLRGHLGPDFDGWGMLAPERSPGPVPRP